MIQIIGGVITSIDPTTYNIEAKLPTGGYVSATPLRFENEPRVNDEVLLFVLEDKFAAAIYIPFRLLNSGPDDNSDSNFVGLARNGYKIELKEDGGIMISSENENQKIELKDGVVTIDASRTVITGATPTSAVPGVSGNLNCIPKCPLLGIDHGCTTNIKGF